MTGAYCASCGSPRDGADPVYSQVADSFLKLSAIRAYVTLYLRLLRSPTQSTVLTFVSADLQTGLRFLEGSVAVYLLAIAASGIPLLGDNELLETVLGALWPLVTFSLSWTLYFLAMRPQAGIRRTSREYVLFASVSLGFTLPVSIPAYFGIWGNLFVLVVTIPMYVYLTRVWRWFWATSGARAFGTLFACTVAGGLLGTLMLLPVWLAFGWPVP